MRKTSIIALIAILLCIIPLAYSQEEIQISLEQNSSYEQIEVCGNYSVMYTVTNFGQYTETFDLGVTQFTRGTFLSENPLVINPYEQKNVTSWVYPSCDVYGSYSPALQLIERVTQTTFEAPMQVDIIPVDVAVIAEGIDRLRVDYSKNLLQIPVQNIGPEEAEYLVEIEGADWVKLEEGELTIESNGQANVNLVSEPTNETESGIYTITLVLQSTKTGLEYAKEFNILLKTPTLLDELLTTYRTFTLIGAVLILILFIVLIVLIIYLARTKEERSARKEERQKEKEKAKEEKKRLKEEKKLAKQKEKEMKRKEKEEAKKIRDKEKEEARKQKEKEREEREKAKEEERRKKEEEKEKLRAEKQTAKKEKNKNKLKTVMFSEIKKEYKLVRKDGKKRSLVPYFIILGILIVLGVLGYVFWERILAFKFYVMLGVVIAFALFLILEFIAYMRRLNLINSFEEKEFQDIKQETKEELKKDYKLISREFLAKIKTKVKVKNFIFFLVLILAGATTYYYGGEIGQIRYAIYAGIGAVIVLLFLGILVSNLMRKKNSVVKEYGEIKAGKTQSIQLKPGKGIGEIVFTPKKAVESVIIKVSRAKKETFVAAPELAYQYFNIDKYGLKKSNVERCSLRFKVAKKWIKKNNVDEIHLMRYEREKWMRISDIKQINEDEKYIYYEAEHKGLNSNYAITAKTKKTEPKENKGLSYLLTIAIIIIVVFFCIIAYQQYQVFMKQRAQTGELDDITKDIEQLTEEIAGIAATEGIPDQTMTEGEILRLDLSKYFVDPDGEELAYSNTPLDGVQISYQQGEAIIVPDEGYAGEQEIVFTATDPKGQSVNSNSVTLTVLRDNTLYGKLKYFFRQYGVYFVIGFVLLVVIILVVEIKKRLDEGEEEITEDFDEYEK